MTRKIKIANPHDRSMLRSGSQHYGWNTYILGFGAYGDTYLIAYASDLDSALEECAAWLFDNEPGHFVTPGYQEACEEAGLGWPRSQGCDEDEEAYQTALEKAEADLTYTESGWIPSWEWTVVGEDMSPDEIRRFAKGLQTCNGR